MEPGRVGMYPPIYAQQGAPPAGYAPPGSYVVHHRVEVVNAAPPPPPPRDGYGKNPYVYIEKVEHRPGCPVSPERRRKNRVANALAAAFIVCWCCTWPCHGPCCCGL